MVIFIDLTGSVFSELKVIERANDRISQSGRKIVMWKCLCSCGKYIEVRGDSLRRGHTKSCGHNRKNKKGNKYDLSGDYGVGYTYKNEPFYFDLEDYNKIKEYTWYKNKNGYICSTDNGDFVSMHRLVMNITDNNFDVDHIKHILYDNRKEELRICRHSDNIHNHVNHNHNISGVSGVYFESSTNKWRASIKYLNKTIHLGRFIDFDNAVKARKAAEEKYFGEYSYDNSQGVKK